MPWHLHHFACTYTKLAGKNEKLVAHTCDEQT